MGARASRGCARGVVVRVAWLRVRHGRAREARGCARVTAARKPWSSRGRGTSGCVHHESHLLASAPRTHEGVRCDTADPHMLCGASPHVCACVPCVPRRLQADKAALVARSEAQARELDALRRTMDSMSVGRDEPPRTPMARTPHNSAAIAPPSREPRCTPPAIAYAAQQRGGDRASLA
eukprot:3188275-Prymnesium_polylepis.1